MHDRHPEQSQPEWDSSDPSGSFQQMSKWLNEEARRVFLRDNCHAQMFFLYRENGQGAILPMPPDVDKDTMANAIKSAIRDYGVYGFAHISETWSYFPRQPNDHTFKQVYMGEMAVSDLKPGEKSEGLMVRAESRDGYCHVWLSPIVRSPGGVALADPMEFDEPPGGRYGTMFS